MLIKVPMVQHAVVRYWNRRRPSFDQSLPWLTGAKALEIGGPTLLFGRKGAFPVYTVVDTLDNLNFSSENFWSNIDEGMNFRFDKDKPAGRQFISDATDLSKIESGSYDLLISSHVIEHIANPLKALREWRRVLKPGGHMVIIAPDKRYSYDRNRPVTDIQHIIADFRNDTPESDTTHFHEIIELHDMAADGTGATYDEHVERTHRNIEHRMSHHHVFDESLVIAMLREAGLEVLLTDVFRQYHLLAVVRNPA